MKKYLAGGRCGGGGSGSQEQKDGQGVNQAFQQMLAARDAQVANLFNPGQTHHTQQTIPFTTGSGLTPFTQTQQAQQTQSKKDDIKLILGRSQIC